MSSTSLARVFDAFAAALAGEAGVAVAAGTTPPGAPDGVSSVGLAGVNDRESQPPASMSRPRPKPRAASRLRLRDSYPVGRRPVRPVRSELKIAPIRCVPPRYR